MLTAVAAFSGLSTDDLGKAKEFYNKKLGLKLIDETMGLQFDLPGGSQLFVYDKPDHKPAIYTALNFVVTDIDKAVDELKEAGVEMEIYEDLGFDAKQDEKGVLRGLAANMGPDIAWFKDPAGNILSVLQDK